VVLAKTTPFIEAILQKADDYTVKSNVFSQEVLEGIYAYAYRYYDLKRYKEALPLFAFLCSQNLENSIYWLGLGGCYQQLREYEKAAEAYGFAAVYNEKKNDPYPAYYAAECYLSLKKIPQALKAMKSAFSICGKQEKFKTLRNRLRYLYKTWSAKQKNEEA
jgi:type III secretion system low calcium response chaperone LcrH/SycD